MRLLVPASNPEAEREEPGPPAPPRTARAAPSPGPGPEPGSRPPNGSPPQPWDPHRSSSIRPEALLDHAPALSTRSRTLDRLMTRLLSDRLPAAGPAPGNRSVPGGRPPRSSPPQPCTPRSGPAGAGGVGFAASPTARGASQVLLSGARNPGAGRRGPPEPFSLLRRPEAGRPRALTAGPHFRGPGPRLLCRPAGGSGIH